MSHKILGTDNKIIGCLLNPGCLYSIPCNCYNCKHFNLKKIGEYEKEKFVICKLANPTKLEPIIEEKKPDESY